MKKYNKCVKIGDLYLVDKLWNSEQFISYHEDVVVRNIGDVVKHIV